MDNNVNKKVIKGKRPSSKRLMLSVIGVICGLTVLFYGVVFIANKVKNNKNDLEPSKYTFDYANYDENIFDDAVYMGYDRGVTYTNGNLTVTVDRDHLDDVSEAYRETVLFMFDYIDAMINGDVQKFNSMYAASFFTDGRTPKERFTQQKIYAANIVAVDNWYDDSGSSAVTYYNIGIDYMIKNNNGTLRDDMGSDAVRRKYLTIRKDADGVFAITAESYFSSLEENRK